MARTGSIFTNAPFDATRRRTRRASFSAARWSAGSCPESRNVVTARCVSQTPPRASTALVTTSSCVCGTSVIDTRPMESPA